MKQGASFQAAYGNPTPSASDGNVNVYGRMHLQWRSFFALSLVALRLPLVATGSRPPRDSVSSVDLTSELTGTRSIEEQSIMGASEGPHGVAPARGTPAKVTVTLPLAVLKDGGGRVLNAGGGTPAPKTAQASKDGTGMVRCC